MRIDIHHAKPITGGFGLRIATQSEKAKQSEQKWAHEIQLRIAEL